MPKNLKEIPNFKDETEEREFWAENDSTDFVDWEQTASVILPNLKPTTKTTLQKRIGEKIKISKV